MNKALRFLAALALASAPALAQTGGPVIAPGDNLAVAGGNDPRVPVNEAEQMVKTVRSNNTPVWYLMAKDEGHGFAKKKNQDFQFYATIMFVRETLLK